MYFHQCTLCDKCRERGVSYSGRIMIRCGWKVNGVIQMPFERYIGQVPIMVKVLILFLCDCTVVVRSTVFLHGICVLHECIYGECAHRQHVRRTLTLTHMITAYSVSGNVRVHILICATRQTLCRKRVYLVVTLTSTRYPQRDGEAELAWMGGINAISALVRLDGE